MKNQLEPCLKRLFTKVLANLKQRKNLSPHLANLSQEDLELGNVSGITHILGRYPMCMQRKEPVNGSTVALGHTYSATWEV